MKKSFILFVLITAFSIYTSCNDSNNTNTTTVNGSNPAEESSSTSSTEEVNLNTQTAETTKESAKTANKTDAEILLAGGELLANVTLNLIERQRIKDSINSANKEKMYAYFIGVKMKEKQALKAYNELRAKTPSIYVFKAGRKEYYIIKFEAKGEEELTASLDDFKTQLGENGTEGVKVMNLTDFCSKRETITKDNMSEDDIEIKCLKCN